MITAAILFLPCMTCLFWLALNPLVNKKGKAFKALELLLGFAAIALFAEAGMACTSGNVMMSLFLTKQFFAPLIIPAVFVYYRSLLYENKPYSSAQTIIAVPVTLLFAQIILIMLIGADEFTDIIQNPIAHQNDKAGRLVYLCSFLIFYAVLAVEALMFIIFAIVKSIRKNSNLQLHILNSTVIIYAALEVSVILRSELPLWIQAVISAILACALYILSYSGVFPGRHNLSVQDLADGLPSFEPDGDEWAEQESAPGIGHNPTDITDLHQNMADEESLRVRFEDLIVSEQLFLRQGIRLSDIAAMLKTNRTYISRLVNNTYNMSFSDYINTLRIDYAEQYLLRHRDAKQSDIAAACGFPNASAFNNVFKKITGVTPKIWLATRS